MKIKVELGKDETIEDSEEFLKKALKIKSECTGKEQYNDPALNDFHDSICDKHSDLLDKLLKDIKEEILHNVIS